MAWVGADQLHRIDVKLKVRGKGSGSGSVGGGELGELVRLPGTTEIPCQQKELRGDGLEADGPLGDGRSIRGAGQVVKVGRAEWFVGRPFALGKEGITQGIRAGGAKRDRRFARGIHDRDPDLRCRRGSGVTVPYSPSRRVTGFRRADATRGQER